MDKRSLSLLGDSERMLVLETEKAALAALDEDGLVALHTRVRRARDKYVGQYRRGAATRVGSAGGRGKAHAQNQRARDRAEVFEAALARVSTALGRAARASAAELKAERLSAARSGGAGPEAQRTASASTAPGRGRTASGSARPAPSRAKKNASTKAAGARRQAARDARG
ncbi:MAG: hypothetical protein GC157_15990 [Frankiales bacterium]|nr:hypothetical protein [Frankiales bacterium]